MANFTAKSFEALENRANDVFDEILGAIKYVEGACSNMSGVVASGDSNLSARWASVASSLQGPEGKAEMTFLTIRDMITQYRINTIENESMSEADLNEIDDMIAGLSAAADGLSAFGIGSTTSPVYAAPMPPDVGIGVVAGPDGIGGGTKSLLYAPPSMLGGGTSGGGFAPGK